MSNKTTRTSQPAKTPKAAQPNQAAAKRSPAHEAIKSLVLGFSFPPEGSERKNTDAVDGIRDLPTPPGSAGEPITRYHLVGVLSLQLASKTLEDMGQAASEALCRAFTAELLGTLVQVDDAVYDLVCVPAVKIAGPPPWGMEDYHLWPSAVAQLKEMAGKKATKARSSKRPRAGQSSTATKPRATRGE